ncbi:MAG: hypothetical protein KAR43_01815, partial [Deltaproteobacteria bacterium]|nr:hypothetical protein [Deltaproteobacteria bacterium]
FLDRFNREIIAHRENVGERDLLNEIDNIPLRHRPEVVKGVGKLVGAEMLFDPMLSLDYPLDSSFGKHFSGGLQEAFFEGVGAGFAETLTRFYRTLLLPEDPASPLSKKILEIEWKRYRALISKLSPSHSARIDKGFLMALQKGHLDDGIRKYLHRKLLRN